jgi:hypothetical protein
VRNVNPQPTMTILSSHSSYNLTAGTILNRVVYDIDNISEGESNGGESVTEPDTEPHGNKHSDYRPENQLGLPENQYWGVHLSDFDGSEESDKSEFLFSCRDGLGL